VPLALATLDTPYFTPLPFDPTLKQFVGLAAPTDGLPGVDVPKTTWTATASAYLANDWDLATNYAHTVASAVARAAQVYHIDPLLLLAVAATESSFKHNIGNPDGGADPMRPYGIMQIAGRYHRDKFPNGAVVRTGVAENILIGASVLRDYLDLEDGDLRRALRRYSGSNDDRYFQKVKSLRHRFHSALSDDPV
jgi:soluble lytic murein transglycosylase-like protein